MTERIIELSITGFILGAIATMIFAIACIKRRDLFLWLLSYISINIGGIFTVFEIIISSAATLLSYVFFVLAIILIFISVSKEYYDMFLKNKILESHNKSLISAAAIVINPTVLGLEFFIICLAVITIIMLLRIFFRKRTPTHAFFVLDIVIALCALIMTIMSTFGVERISVYMQAMMVLLSGMFLSTSLVVIVERKIIVMNKALENVIKKASETSVNVSNVAIGLAASSSEVNASAEEIATTTQQITNDSRIIMESSNEIQNIMDLITNISEQTNLLSLNASIEAGRAGEQGRGFAVVAQEIRKLADESKTAVSTSSRKIEEIISRIRASKDSMEGISASSEEQTASMEEITTTANKLGALAEDLKLNLISPNKL